MGANDMTRPGFGWIVQTIARDGAHIETINEDIDAYVRALGDGFDTLWFDDHLMKTGAPLLECWTTLAFLAARYPYLRVGTLVLSHSFRNPGLTGKMMATLQVLTRGRFIAGIGAGWKEDEFLAYGYPFLPPRQRVDALEEAVQILRAMWSHSPASFEGQFYSLRNADCEPLPPRPIPLLIGGTGEKRTLRLVAQYADWFNMTFPDLAGYARKLDLLRQHCRQVGRDYDEITKSLWTYIHFNQGEDVSDRYGRPLVAGTPAQVTAALRAFMALGCSHFMVRFADYPKTDMLETFQREVLPAL